MPNQLAKYFDNLLHLKAVIDSGSINKAAEAVSLSQPALTRSIHRLETRLGVRLLNRTSRGVVPTAFGEALVGHVRMIDSELEHAITAMNVLKGATEGRVACGGSAVAANALLPAAAHEFLKTRPRLQVRIVEGYSPTLVKMLRLGELDMVVGFRMEHADDPDLVAEKLGTEEVGIFARSTHRIANRPGNVLREMVDNESWIMPNATGPLNSLIRRAFARYGVDWPRSYIETSSMNVLRWLLTESDRIALTTSQFVDAELRSGRVKTIRGDWEFAKTSNVLYSRRREASSPAALSFIKCLKRVAREIDF